MNNFVRYTPIFISYDIGQQIPTNCNSITFINLGTSIAFIESVPLQPNQSLSIDGNAYEFTESLLSLRFSSGVGLQNNLVVIKKMSNYERD
jgi:hypothetical protein